MSDRDFDRIAQLDDGGWDHNAHYHPYLVGRLPAGVSVGSALDVGSGTGAFARCLAGRAERVIGLDESPEMVRVARERSAGVPNVEFEVADFSTWVPPDSRFDCVASIATLHHLPLDEALAKMRRVLRPGGTLLVLDLFRESDLGDRLQAGLAVPVAGALRLLKTGRLRPDPELQRAWDEHGRSDSYPTLGEVRALCDDLLPGARVRRHLLWRYSIVWVKPTEANGSLARERSRLAPAASGVTARSSC